MKNRNFWIGIVMGGLLSSCSNDTPETGDANSPGNKIVVQTVNYPLFYFATRLADDKFDSRYLVNSQEDPAFWNPSDESVQAFQQADLIIRNGAGYAKWMKSISLPSRKMLDTSAAFSKGLITQNGTAHQHGNGEAHEHGDLAFTTWLDFDLAEKQARSIAEKFSAISPQSKEAIQKNFEALAIDLRSLDEQMMLWSKKWGNRPLLVSHPVYQYWGKRYGLNIKSVHWEPDMKWNADRMKELTNINSDHNARWMVWEGSPDAALTASLKETGIDSILFDPSGNRPDKESDWLSAMKHNIASLERLTSQKKGL